jgi:uroporphyrinogen III methyltransferase/synthase
MLESYGLLVDYVPGEYRAEQIVEGLKDRMKAGERVLLPRADIARKVLPDALQQKGAMVTEVPAYKTVMAEGDVAPVRDMLQNGEIQVITFTSSSTVRNFVKMLATPDLNALLQGVTVACIGPVTADTARELGVKVNIIAKEYTIDGLVQAILEHFYEKPE